MAQPNIVNATTILGSTDVLAVTTTPTDITTNAVSSGKVYKVNVLTIANVDGANTADITASLYRGAVEYKILHTVTVAPDSTLVAISKESTVYLEEADSIRLTASANGDLVGVCSYEEIS